MNDEQDNQVSRFFLTIAVIAILILVLAGCTSQEEKREYRKAQVSMVQTQVSAKTQQDIADATARTALYEAMARVAAASPDNADAIAVALAVSSVREETKDSQPIVQLQREENEALAVVKAVAPSLLTTIGTVGVAAIQGEVNKTQSDNAAAVSIAQAATEASVMENVTNMATAGLLNAGSRVTTGGDYMIADNIDQSVTTTSTSTESYSESNSSTISTTETNDSYNQVTTDSNNVYESTNGSLLSFGDIEALLASGMRVTIIIEGEEVEVEQAECEDGSTGLTFGGDSIVCEG